MKRWPFKPYLGSYSFYMYEHCSTKGLLGLQSTNRKALWRDFGKWNLDQVLVVEQFSLLFSRHCSKLDRPEPDICSLQRQHSRYVLRCLPHGGGLNINIVGSPYIANKVGISNDFW